MKSRIQIKIEKFPIFMKNKLKINILQIKNIVILGTINIIEENRERLYLVYAI